MAGLGRSGFFAAGQSVIVIVCVFLNYRIIINQLGISSLGLWSLLMAFSGFASIIDISGAGMLSRSISRHDLDFSDTSRASVVHTVLITSVAINLTFIAALMVLAPIALPHLVEPDQMTQAWQILPWVIVLMGASPLVAGLSSSLDGLMRADLRAVLVSVASIVGLAISWITIPRTGLIGVGVGQCLQQIIVIVGAWLILRKHIPGLGWIPHIWHKSVFRQTTGYALKLNGIGLMGLLLEPLIKYCINLSGGTTAVGVYELAARLAVQLRSLVVSSVIPLIPAFAATTGSGDVRLAQLLQRAQLYVVYAAGPVAVISVVAAPIMCQAILGHGSVEILRSNALLAFGWSINLFSIPLYFAAQSQAVLRWNVAGQAITMACVMLGSLSLAPILGATGVVIGIVVGLVIGAFAQIVGNGLIFGQGAALRRDIPRMVGVVGLLSLICAGAWLAAPGVAAYSDQLLQ